MLLKPNHIEDHRCPQCRQMPQGFSGHLVYEQIQIEVQSTITVDPEIIPDPKTKHEKGEMVHQT